MEAKEKAIQLIDKYRSLEINGIGQIKKAALITVEEIKSIDIEMNSSTAIKIVKYWNKVKQEINKL